MTFGYVTPLVPVSALYDADGISVPPLHFLGQID